MRKVKEVRKSSTIWKRTYINTLDYISIYIYCCYFVFFFKRQCFVDASQKVSVLQDVASK